MVIGSVRVGFVVIVERVAEWLRNLTRDQEVGDSIPTGPVMFKSLGQALNPHNVHPAVMGTRWNENLVLYV